MYRCCLGTFQEYSPEDLLKTFLAKEYAQQQQGQQRWVAAVSRAPTPNGPWNLHASHRHEEKEKDAAGWVANS